jgi:hypothetical protein
MVKQRRHNRSQELWGKLGSLVTVRALRWFFVATGVSFFLAASLNGMLSNGQRYALNFVDIDGHKLSTADGHVTVLVLATTGDAEKARAVADSVPDYCLGNPKYKMITIINFTRKHTVIGRTIATTFLRHRIKEEARRLQARYDARKIVRDARSDIFTVTDFDGTAVSQLGGLAAASPSGGGQTEATSFHVFVFGKDGELLKQWDNVPAADDLAAVLK